MLAIVESRIDPAAVLAAVASPAVGGTSLFVGTVRETNDGQAVVRIAYEAHLEMARAVLTRIAADVGARWPGVRLAIVHRLGLVELGEASVAIAAATPHRAEAFAACRHAIERIKADLPVWKREFHPDGTSTWAACHETGTGHGTA